ncbi:MAG: hypothetical protein IAE65_11265, partial [Ignavibacteria bacterium]|nr:hypothetical protein [Ignavibacteria bacterium]
LLTPENNSSIEPDEPIVFSWMDLSSKGPYKIKIVEIKGDESPENAMLKNKAFFEKEDIRTTMLQYPSSAPKFIEWKKYAWNVESGKVKSGVMLFSIGGASQTRAIIDSIKCTSTPGEYQFWIRMCVDNDNLDFNFADISELSFTTYSNPQPSLSTYSIAGIMPALPQQISTPTTGTSCISFEGRFTSTVFPVTSVQLVFKLELEGSSTEIDFQRTPIFNPINDCSSISGCNVSVNAGPDITISMGETAQLNGNLFCQSSENLFDSFTMRTDQLFTYSTPPTVSGVNYCLRVSGTYSWNYRFFEMDAAFKSDNRLPGGGITPYGNYIIGYPSGVRPTPDVYNPNHIYFFNFTGNGQPINVRFDDNNTYGDNRGSLLYEIYECGDCNCTYSWNPSTNLSDPNILNPVFTPSAPGTYTFLLTADCGDCIDSDEIIINVTDVTNLCNCERSHWSDIGSEIGYTKNGVMSAASNFCGGNFNVDANTNVTLSPNYTCFGSENCNARYTYSINGGTPTGFMPSPFSVQVGNINTTVRVYAYCGDKICDSCDVNLIPIETPKPCFDLLRVENLICTGSNSKGGFNYTLSLVANNLTGNPVPTAGTITISCVGTLTGLPSTFAIGENTYNLNLATSNPTLVSCCIKFNQNICSDQICFELPKCGNTCLELESFNSIVCKGKNSSGGYDYSLNLVINNPALNPVSSSGIALNCGTISGLPPTLASGSHPYPVTLSTTSTTLTSCIINYSFRECKDEMSIQLPLCTKCDCGYWTEDKWISYGEDKKKVRFGCFDKNFHTDICAKEEFTLFSEYSCSKDCKASYKWILTDLSTNLTTSGTSDEMPLTVVPTDVSKYNLKVYAICDGKVCDSCSVNFITTDCGVKPKCECFDGKWQRGSLDFIDLKGKKVSSILECEKSYKTVKSGTQVTFTKNYFCNPKDCKATYNYRVIDENGNLITDMSGIPIEGSDVTMPISFTPNYNGTATVEITPLCGDEKCQPCIFSLEIFGKEIGCKCEYGEGKIGIKDKAAILFNCKEGYNTDLLKFKVGDNIILDPGLKCDNSCKGIINWKVTGPAGFTPVSGSAFAINFMPSIAGIYLISSSIICGTDTCRCETKIVVEEKSTKCICGVPPLTNFTYNVDAGKPKNIKCGDFITISKNQALTFNYTVNCPDQNCPPSVSWNLVNENSLGTTLTNGNHLSGVSLTGNLFSIPGRYILTIYIKCGDKTCEECKIFITVSGDPSGCNCSGWEKDRPVNLKSIDLNYTSNIFCGRDNTQKLRWGNTTLTAPNYICSGSRCLPTYKWRIIRVDDNVDVTPANNSGQSINFNFININTGFPFNRYTTYSITITVSCGINQLPCRDQCNFTLFVGNYSPFTPGRVSLGNIGVNNPKVIPSIFNPITDLRPEFKWDVKGTEGNQKFIRLLKIEPRRPSTTESDMLTDIIEKEPVFDLAVGSNSFTFPNESESLELGSVYIWYLYESDEKGNINILEISMFQAGSNTPQLAGNPCAECLKNCNGGCFWNGSGACICFERLPSDKKEF